MKISISKLLEIYDLVKEFFGLLHKAEDVLQDKPLPPAKEYVPPAGKPKDETDPNNEYHLNQ